MGSTFPYYDEYHEKLLVWEFFDFSYQGFFVEVGANEPGMSSQSWLLERIGWKGVLVEPLPAHVARNRAERTNSTVFEGVATSPEQVGELTLHVGEHHGTSSLEPNKDDHGIRYVAEVKVPARTLDSILESAGVTAVDFLAIDTEGHELEVLKGATLRRWKPRLLLLEDKLVDLARHRLLRANGYRLVKRTALNNWYVPDEAEFSLTSWTERLSLFRKFWLGLPFRKLRHWRHHRA